VKISARDRQRAQWCLTALVGGAAVLYACIHLLIGPLQQVRVAELDKLAVCNEQLDKARNGLRDLAADSNEVVKLQAELDVATNRFVVRPVLGSTLVSVQGIVEPIAASCGLQIESYAEHGRNEMPVTTKDAGVILERYLMEVSVAGSYAALRDFLQAVEKTNAYVCVTDVEILGGGENPAKHKARICMEWPVFGARKAAPPARSPAEHGARTEEHP
jgi:hypothetical protein